jgi:hypothetical protein
MASRTRGYAEKLEIYEEEHRKWLVRSQYWNEAGGFADEAIENPNYAVNFIEGGSNDPKVNGDNAIGLMLRWLVNEWKQDLMSVEDCREIFYPGLEDAPETCQDTSAVTKHHQTIDFAAYIENKASSEVSDAILGSFQEPVSTSKFLATYNRLLN